MFNIYILFNFYLINYFQVYSDSNIAYKDGNVTVFNKRNILGGFKSMLIKGFIIEANLKNKEKFENSVEGVYIF